MKRHAPMHLIHQLARSLTSNPWMEFPVSAKGRQNIGRTSVCLGLLVASTCNQVFAQTAPDAGTILRDVERNLQIAPVKTLPPVELPDAESNQTAGIKVLVKEFRITHTRLIQEAELQSVVAEFVGKELNFEQLQSVALKVSDYYRKKGFFARVFLAHQVIKDGIVEITVVEGTLGRVDVETPAGSRLKSDVAKQTILAQQKIGAPLRPEDAQRGLRILNEIPGYSATATLQPGEKEGETNLLAKAQDTPLLSGLGMLDNYGVKSTGENRFIVGLSVNNPSGQGDQLGLFGLYSTGTQFARAAYTARVGYDGLRLGVNASALRYTLGGSFASLNASGTADTWGFSSIYPMLMKTGMNLYLDAAFDHKHLVNTAQGTNTSDKTIGDLTLALRGDRIDEIAGRGINQFNLALTSGNATFANAADLAADRASANTDGSFQKITYTATRLQKLTDTTGLFINLSGQFANKNLDSSEKFSLGGPNGIRAYPMGEAPGDEGWMINAEARHNLSDGLQLVGFLDTGHIQLNQNAWANWNAPVANKPNTYQLSGAGVALNYVSKNGFMVRSSLAARVGSNPGHDANGNDSDGSKSQARMWVQLNKTF